MQPLHRRALLLGLWVVPACTSQPPPPAKPAPTPVASSSAPTSFAAPEPDLSPVPAPKSIVAIGRWANVSASLKAAEKISNSPFPLDGLLQKELGDKEFFALVKLDGSVDAAAMLDPSSRPDDPKLIGVVSLPLRDMKESLAMANRSGKPVQVRPGVYRIGRARDLVCDLSVSVGDAPARLLCSENERDLDALVPWMTRSLPSEKFGAGDLHLELRADGLRERFKEEIATFGPSLPTMVESELVKAHIQTREFISLSTSMAADLPKIVNDLDAMTFDVRLDGDKTQVDVAGTVRFKGNSSWLVKLITHRQSEAGPAPAIFWQAPKDSDAVSFNRGADPKLFDGVREGLSAVTRDLLTLVSKDKKKLALADADIKAIADLIAKAPLNDAKAVVVARGHAPRNEKERKIDPAKYSAADAIRDTQDQVRNTLGWTLVGVESKADPLLEWLKSAEKTYNSGSLQGLIKKGVKGDKKAERLVPVVRTTAAPKGAPKGTVAYEISINLSSDDVWYSRGRQHEHREKPKAASTGKVALYFTVTPEGNRTWIGFGADPNLIGSHLAAVKEGAPKDGTIASRTDLDELKNGQNTGGGFVSFGGIIEVAASTLRSELRDRDRKELEGALASMPNKGATPVLLFAKSTTGDKPSGTLEARIQKGTLNDIAGLGRYFFMLKGNHRDGAMTPPAPPPPPMPPGKP